MSNVNHIQYPDSYGRVYCKAYNDIVKLDFDRCIDCIYFNGDYQGNGVECLYEGELPTYSDNPGVEYDKNNTDN